MDARQKTDLSEQGANLARITAIHADAFTQCALTNRLLLQGAECSLEVLLAFRELFLKCCQSLVAHSVNGLVAGKLAFSLEGLGQLVTHLLFEGVVLFVGVIKEELKFACFLGGLLRHLHLCFAARE